MMDAPKQVNYERYNILQVTATVVFKNECYSSPSALFALFLGTDLSSENLPNDPTRDSDDGLEDDEDEEPKKETRRKLRMAHNYRNESASVETI